MNSACTQVLSQTDPESLPGLKTQKSPAVIDGRAFRKNGILVFFRALPTVKTEINDDRCSETATVAIVGENKGNECSYWHSGGDNGGRIRKIRDKFYLFEEWC